jgi:hypothetical protein
LNTLKVINTHTLKVQRASKFRPADSNSSGYWQMVCVGMRAWAWKRLMVKSIFFDALAKVMTRSSVQLSLYGTMRDNQDSSLQKVYQRNELQAQLEAHKASSSVFGDLQYKLELLMMMMSFI